MPNAVTTVSGILHVLRRTVGESTNGRGAPKEIAIRCATLAADADEVPEIIAACLLHDYGHCIGDGRDCTGGWEKGGDCRHHVLAASRLATWFAPAVTEPIRLQREARRYLARAAVGCPASMPEETRGRVSVGRGSTREDEARWFEQQLYAEGAIRVRRYVEGAEKSWIAIRGLETFGPLLEGLIRRSSGWRGRPMSRSRIRVKVSFAKWP